jgi:hypothetical protein
VKNAPPARRARPSWRPGAGATLAEQHITHPCRRRGAQDGTDVAGILNRIEQTASPCKGATTDRGGDVDHRGNPGRALIPGDLANRASLKVTHSIPAARIEQFRTSRGCACRFRSPTAQGRRCRALRQPPPDECHRQGVPYCACGSSASARNALKRGFWRDAMNRESTHCASSSKARTGAKLRR